VPAYAAFLRGVNLGPTRKVSSGELGSVFEGLGFDDVNTFRTSGNVVFTTGREPAAKLSRRIERALEGAAGFEVTIFLRTASQVRAIADHQPFDRPLLESRGKLQVALLGAKPSARLRNAALALATEEDMLAFGDRELYWLPKGGTRDAALSMKAIEGAVGPNTMRTKGTLEQLAAKYLAG
jgi:uncharacterized protein (DUF1697 family)